MRLKKIGLHRRTKNKNKSHPKVESTPTEESTSHSDDGASSHISDTRDERESSDTRDERESSSLLTGPYGGSVPRISKDANRSALAMLARVSCTIGETLTEEEFGSTRDTNILYRPSLVLRQSQIVHPVVCKRDIFVRSVTPTRKMGFKKSLYHPPTQNDETKLTEEEGNDHFSLLKALKKKENLDENSNLKSNQDFVPSYSTSSSMIETGRIAGDDPQIMRTKTNPENLHCVPPEQHNGREAKDYGTPSRFTRVVSPSPTVSSLSMCTDFETPRNYHKPPLPNPYLSSPAPLEGIEEQGGIITSGASESSDVDYCEI